MRSRRLLLALLCSSTACDGAARDPAHDAGCERAAPAAPEAGTCRFAHTPVDLQGHSELLNTPSERREAPAGGLWWLVRSTSEPTLTATRDDGTEIELAVADDIFTITSPFTALHVPPELPVGARLHVGCSVLTVAPPLPALDLQAIVLEHAFRPDLGGRGFVVRLPPEARSRVFVVDAWAHAPGANVQTGVHVLQHLLLADAHELCGLPPDLDAGELFVPAHADLESSGIGIGISLRDADAIDSTRFNRVCNEPDKASVCYPSTLEIPPSP